MTDWLSKKNLEQHKTNQDIQDAVEKQQKRAPLEHWLGEVMLYDSLVRQILTEFGNEYISGVAYSITTTFEYYDYYNGRTSSLNHEGIKFLFERGTVYPDDYISYNWLIEVPARVICISAVKNIKAEKMWFRVSGAFHSPSMWSDLFYTDFPQASNDLKQKIISLIVNNQLGRVKRNWLGKVTVKFENGNELTSTPRTERGSNITYYDWR